MSFRPNWSKMLNRSTWEKKLYGKPKASMKGFDEKKFKEVEEEINRLFREDDEELRHIFQELKEGNKVNNNFDKEEEEDE